MILMPFQDDRLNRHYREVIQPAVEACSYKCLRVDEIPGATFKITKEIIIGIETADVIVTNITNQNANVFYELGMAHSFGTNVLIIVEKGENRIPFDLQEYKIFQYDYNSKGNEQLTNFIRENLINLNWVNHPNNPIHDNSDRIKKLLDFSPPKERYDNSNIAESIYNQITNFQSKLPEDCFTKHVISISGPVAIGKTTFANTLKKIIDESEGEGAVSILPLDSYMLDRETLLAQNIPNGYDDKNWNLDKVKGDIEELILNRNPIKLRNFNHRTGRHNRGVQTVDPAKYIILDGIISFQKIFSDYCNMKIFIAGRNIRLEQNPRIQVAYHERNYTLKEAIIKSDRELKDYCSYLFPRRKEADVWLILKDNTWSYDLYFDYPSLFYTYLNMWET